jgi:hypothetical protein
MKRIIYYLLVFVTLFALVGSVVALADEGEAEITETTETTEETVTETEETNIFTRLYEAFQENKTNVFTIASGAILFIFSFIFRKDVTVSSKVIVDGIKNVIAKSDLTEAQQDAIVSGLNEMVDGYNDIKLKTDIVGTQMQDIARSNASLEKKIEDVFNALVSLIDKEILQNATVMDVLSSVYINNGALPKGVRDYVMLKRSENARLVQEAAVIEHKDEGGVVSE